jgi:YidC/Oxa1 family membrane protein insertase
MDQRNLIIAAVISIAILFGWQIIYEQPRIEKAREAAELKKTEEQTKSSSATIPSPTATVPSAPGAGVPPAPTGGQVPTAPVIGAPQISEASQRKAVLSQAPRLTINSPRLRGSIQLKGGHFDDLVLANYRETLDADSSNIALLSPARAPKSYFAQFGWSSSDRSISLPNDNTQWTASGTNLSPKQPVTLRWDNGAGLIFSRTLALDENYVFTVTQQVQNNTNKPITLFPYGLISRSETPQTLGFFILHEGPLAVLDGTLQEFNYDTSSWFFDKPGLQEEGTVKRTTKGGWLGITDKYWLVALLPDQKAKLQTAFRHTLDTKKIDKYQVDYLGEGQVASPGTTVSVTNRLFAGAKEVNLLDEYLEKLQIARFDLAIDWGWFYFLTKPIFYALEYFFHLLGNFGLAILLLTVIIKLLFFPLANKSYKAMSRLKLLQPKMVALRERYGDDKAKQNEAMMRLYKEEKVNPAAGCLPMLVQIPVFFALYKVLFVSIEMRQAPFYGWIQDLSAPDPTSIFNLFGLIPWGPPEILLIGAWPLIMGLTMWLQQKLNPAPADPMQAKIFMLLPIVFTFMLARFPAGLVIYWAWNNVLSITQQWVIMRRMGVTASGQAIPGSVASPPPAGSKPKTTGSKPKTKSKTKKKGKAD